MTLDESLMPTRLILVRHAETVWNAEGRQQGHLDSPLTPLGRAQARVLGRRLAGIGTDTIYSSDLGRAQETARLIAEETAHIVQLDSRLREQNLGIFSGWTKAEIQQRHPVEYARYRSEGPGYIIPGGESAAHRASLAVSCLEELAQAHRETTIVVVGHEGMVGAFIRHVQALSGRKVRRVKLLNASVSIFVSADGLWHAEVLNDVRHLSAPGSDTAVDATLGK